MTHLSLHSPYRPSDARKATSYPEYGIWKGMRTRCNNSRVKDYKWYGSQGVTVCEEWNDFWRFLHDMGPRPTPNHTIERRDSKGPYSKDNCCWLPKSDQNSNMSSNRPLTMNGETHLAIEWSKSTGLSETLITQRMDRGWDDTKILTTPAREKKTSRIFAICDGARLQGPKNTVSVTFVFEGQNRNLHEIAALTGIPYGTLYVRIARRGWDPQRAFSTPPSESHKGRFRKHQADEP